MARAIAVQMSNYAVSGETASFTFGVLFYGAGVRESGDYDFVTFDVLTSDTTNSIGGKFAQAIRDRATQLGYSLPNNAVLIPAYTKA